MNAHDDTPAPERAGLPVTWVAAGAGALLVLGLTFYGGTAFGRHQAKKELATVTGLREALGEDEGDEQKRPVELQIGETVAVETPEGPISVMLESTGLDYEVVGEGVQREAEYTVVVTNTGGSARVVSTLDGHFENSLGSAREAVLSTCLEDPALPPDPVPPGESVRGCESLDISYEAGRVVFDRFTPELYIEVPAD